MMRFVLDLFPDFDEEDPQKLLAFAVESVKSNPDLAWDIIAMDQPGQKRLIADGVKLQPEARDPKPGTCIHCGVAVNRGPRGGLLVDSRTGDWWCRANPSNGGDAAPHHVGPG